LTFACALAYEANVALEYPPELFCLPGTEKARKNVRGRGSKHINHHKKAEVTLKK